MYCVVFISAHKKFAPLHLKRSTDACLLFWHFIPRPHNVWNVRFIINLFVPPHPHDTLNEKTADCSLSNVVTIVLLNYFYCDSSLLKEGVIWKKKCVKIPTLSCIFASFRKYNLKKKCERGHTLNFHTFSISKWPLPLVREHYLTMRSFILTATLNHPPAKLKVNV